MVKTWILIIWRQQYIIWATNDVIIILTTEHTKQNLEENDNVASILTTIFERQSIHRQLSLKIEFSSKHIHKIHFRYLWIINIQKLLWV
jgi:hypothetical protein